MSLARITWIGGPVLRARMEGPFSVYESLAVGSNRLLGEVIQLRGDELVAQVYEDTTGLEPGDEVSGIGRSLSVPLGPGLLGGIFDGLLRRLTGAEDFRVRPGIATSAPGRFRFRPSLEPGVALAPGQPIGTVVAARSHHPGPQAGSSGSRATASTPTTNRSRSTPPRTASCTRSRCASTGPCGRRAQRPAGCPPMRR